MLDVLFFGSTSDFAFNTLWIPSMRLLRFNLFLLFQEHNFRSTPVISFNAIYFCSKIYCTAVDHYCLVHLDLMRSREAGTQFVRLLACHSHAMI